MTCPNSSITSRLSTPCSSKVTAGCRASCSRASRTPAGVISNFQVGELSTSPFHELRTLEVDRLDAIQAALWPMMEDGDPRAASWQSFASSGGVRVLLGLDQMIVEPLMALVMPPKATQEE